MLPGENAQRALREDRWREIEARWGWLTEAEVGGMTGEVAALAGVVRNGELRYPRFQLHPPKARVAPAWVELRQLLSHLGWREEDLLAWAAAPNAWLEGHSPAEEVQSNPEAVTDQVRKAAAQVLPEGPGGGG